MIVFHLVLKTVSATNVRKHEFTIRIVKFMVVCYTFRKGEIN
jgi:hypothetical protein